MLSHYLWEIKISNLSQIKENANKKCHMNQLSFHSYRKIKPRADFEFTIFIASSIGVQAVKNHKIARLACNGPERHWQCNWRVACASSHMCASKRWTIWAAVVIITISIQQCEWNIIFFYKYDESFNFVWQFYDNFFEFPKVVRQHT